MRHRIFIAINLPEEIKKKLADYQDKIEELFTPYRTEGSGAGPCRWTKKENLHITLAFLGYLSDEELLEVINLTKEAVSKNHSFSINLKKIIYGPPYQSKHGTGQAPKKPPRMVWTEGEKSEELGKLQRDLENSLSGSSPGLENEEGRGYTPHITLGRLKQWEFRQVEPEERPEINEEINLSFEVNSIEVMESELKRVGPDYTILESCPLKS